MQTSPTIRLFVSSTFSDLKAERDALQREVFPRLKQLCLAKGLRFQAIDLRWGISDEAGRDNKTMRICLRELKRCQQDRPKPNFLILLGARYGWRPLPETVPADVFEQLSDRLTAENAKIAEILNTWYLRDDNAVLPEYVLQPREGRFGEFAVWESEVERPLLDALVKAAEAAGIDMKKAGLAIGSSATEQEIIEGALNVTDASTHVRAFFRVIDGLPNPAPKDYVETGEPAKMLGDLKDRISDHIGKDNVCKYRVPWRANVDPSAGGPTATAAATEDGGGGPPPSSDPTPGIHPDDLKDFCDQVWKQLSAVVEQQIATLTKTPPDEQEEQAHQDFGKERCRHFVGRKESLDRIAAYLCQGTGAPLAVVGPSGSGKSAFIAKCASDLPNSALRTPHSAIVTRYIGATPASSDLIQLLRNIVGEIRKRYPVQSEGRATISERAAASRENGSTTAGPEAHALPKDAEKKPGDSEIPYEFNPLVNAFHEALQRPTAEKPLFLFLDALDQLTASNNAHSLAWLPAKLSDHVRLVVSAALLPVEGRAPSRPSDSSDSRVAVIAALTARLDSAHRVTLAPLTPADGEQMLTNWLADAQRKLKPLQRDAVLAAFAREGSPLWLRTATEEAARLASWQPAPTLALTTQGLLGQVLERLSREEEHGEMLVSRTLSFMVCARHGLAEDEILDILSADKEVMADFRRRLPNSPKVDSLPVAVWVRLHGDLAFYLAEHQAQGASLLGFYHRSFLEAVTARGLATSEERRARHQHLADWFGKQGWFIPTGTGESKAAQGTISDPPNARKASELPWHLYKVADATDPERCQEPIWQPLADLLCDLFLVEAKVRASLIFELQEDYRFALQALPESQMELEKERQRQERIDRWTKEIIEYARKWSERRDRAARGEKILEPEPILPEPIPPCRMWTEEEIIAECRRITVEPKRLDRLIAFAKFVGARPYPMIAHGKRPVFILQYAFNSDPFGPVHDAAAALMPTLTVPHLLCRWSGNDFYNPKPALLRTIENLSMQVSGVSVTADGRRAVSGGWDNTLRVWDLESGACLCTLVGHKNRVCSVSMTPDGRRVVSGSADNTMRVWDLESGACLHTLEYYTGLFEGTQIGTAKVSVTPDGRRAVSIGEGDTLRVWDLESGVCLRTLEGHRDRVKGHRDMICSVSVTADGRRAVSVGNDDTLWVWDLENWVCLRTLEGPRDMVNSGSVTVDGRHAVSVGSNDKLRARNLSLLTPGLGRPPLSFVHWFNMVRVTPDGRRAVSVGSDNTLRVWDLESGECLRTLEGNCGWGCSLSVTADGRRAVSVDSAHILRVFDLESGVCLRTLEGYDAEVSSVTADGRRAVSVGRDTLRVWDLVSGLCLRRREDHGSVSSVGMMAVVEQIKSKTVAN